MERLQAIVTAGGTSEPIDDVRAITNFSTGRLGHTLAAELAKNEVDTVELCPVSTTQRLGEESNVDYEYFSDTDSLYQSLVERSHRPDIILHAAAVSDYKPIRRSGKISSEQESLMIELERTPKIISQLRNRYGSETFIAGFKLLSNVSETELISAAMTQLKRNRLNLVIANDLKNLRDGQHPLLAVTAEGGVIPFEGERSAVARKLTSFILRRVRVQWFRSVRSQQELSPQANQEFADLLEVVSNMHLLTDESGNISVSDGGCKLVVTPRQVDKSKLTSQDAIPAIVDKDNRTVTYSGERKPSIDTGVSALLYDKYPDLEAIIHFHKGWGRMSSKTDFPFPCGVIEEADEIIDSLEKSNSQDIAVELVHHGFLIGLKNGDRQRLDREWNQARLAFSNHLNEVGMNVSLDESLLRPIFDGVSISGVVYDYLDGAIVFLEENKRGSGLGRQLVEQLIERQYSIRTVEACQVRNFYKKYGFSESYDIESQSYLLQPPERRLQAKLKL